MQTQLAIFLSFFFLAASCSNNKLNPEYDSLYPINLIELQPNEQKNDDNEVTIGSQVWMPVNLNVDTFRNGDPIPEVNTADSLAIVAKEGSPAYCYYDFNSNHGFMHGKLYNWHALIDPRGLAPIGWHIPNDKEWDELTEFLGGAAVAGAKMKADSAWCANDSFANNQLISKSGFNALPSGSIYTKGNVGYIGEYAYYWSNSPTPSDTLTDGYDIWVSLLKCNSNEIFKVNFLKRNYFSVRCIKNKNKVDR
jgi:uncharacterized protein (TIGR02145 family)